MAVLNGRLPTDLLATIPGTSRRIHVALVEQVAALREAFAARFGVPLAVTDGYRPLAEQVDVFLRYYTRTYLPGRPSRVWAGVRYWQRHGFPSAAVPGTSNHGWAVALDLGSGVNASLTSVEHVWMRENAPRFGFVHPVWAHDHVDGNGTDEPWHWEGAPVPVAQYRAIPTAPVVTVPDLPPPLAPTSEEDDMKDHVIALYVYLLGRLPDATGLAGWLVDIGAGKASLATVEQSIRGSIEYQQLDPDERVRRRLALPIW